MKDKLIHISMLGGFYFIISFPPSLFENNILETMDAILFLALMIYAVYLMFGRPLTLLEKFKSKFPKSTIYLVSVGWTIYLALPVLFYGAVSGYRKSMAVHNGNAYDTIAPEDIISLLGIIYWFAVIISLVIATVIVVRKVIMNKKTCKKDLIT